MSAPEQLNVLMVDAGWHIKLSVGIARCLAAVPGVRLHVLSHDPYAPVRWSRHVETFTTGSPAGERALLDQIELIARTRAIDVLLAATERGGRLLSMHAERLSRVARIAPVAPVSSFDTVQDKARFTELLAEHGISVPRTLRVEPHEATSPQTSERLAGLRPPLVAKPIGASSGLGIRRFESAASVAEHLARLKEAELEPLIVQEHVSGDDVCCAVLANQGTTVARSTYEALAVVNPFSPWPCAAFAIDDDVVAAAERICRLLDWSGPAELDFVRTANGEIYALELNGQYDGSVLASLVAGVNFPWLHVQLALGMPVEQPPYRPTLFASNRGLLQQAKARIRRQPRLEIGYRQTYLPFIVRDPLPEVSTAVHLAGSRLTRWL